MVMVDLFKAFNKLKLENTKNFVKCIGTIKYPINCQTARQIINTRCFDELCYNNEKLLEKEQFIYFKRYTFLPLLTIKQLINEPNESNIKIYNLSNLNFDNYTFEDDFLNEIVNKYNYDCFDHFGFRCNILSNFQGEENLVQIEKEFFKDYVLHMYYCEIDILKNYTNKIYCFSNDISKFIEDRINNLSEDLILNQLIETFPNFSDWPTHEEYAIKYNEREKLNKKL